MAAKCVLLGEKKMFVLQHCSFSKPANYHLNVKQKGTLSMKGSVSPIYTMSNNDVPEDV